MSQFFDASASSTSRTSGVCSDAGSNRSRAWCFTLHNYTASECSAINGQSYVYVVYGKERCPTTSTHHLQGYIVFKHAKSFSAAKKFFPYRTHITKALGDSLSNFNYCSKDGDFFESGIRPLSPKEKGDAENKRWDDARALAVSGKLEDIPSDIYIRYYRTLKEISKDHMVAPAARDHLDNIWYWGPSGVGKSLTARTENPGAYKKNLNKWWCGYQNHDCVILEEMNPYCKSLGNDLKIWSDHDAFIGETKGGGISIRPKKFVVTSNYPPEGIWDDEETLSAIRRRFKIVHMTIPFAAIFSPFIPPIITESQSETAEV